MLLHRPARRQSAPFTFPRAFFPLTLSPLLTQQSPSSGSDWSSETPCCFCLKNGTGGGGQKKGEFSKDPRGRPRNIHMLSDSCLRPFPLSTAREGSAGYKRRDPHPCYPPLAVPPSPFTVSAAVSTAATKTTNYCKTSQITFQLQPPQLRPVRKQRGWKQTHSQTQR